MHAMAGRGERLSRLEAATAATIAAGVSRHLPAAAVAVRPHPARPRQRRPADRRADPAAVRAGVRQRRARRAGRPGDRPARRAATACKAPADRLHHRFVRGPAALLPRRRHRQAGGPRHRQRPGGRRRRAAVPLGGVHPRRRAAAGRPAADRRLDARRLRRGRRRARHRRHQGRRSRQGRPGLHHHHRASAWCPRDDRCRSATARPGDRILVSGTIGDHGIAIMSVREGIEFETVLESDCAPLDRPGTDHARRPARAIRCMRDPTRGGVSSALNELADGLAASACGSTRRRSRSGPRSGPPARCSGSIRCTSPTKGS